MNRNCAGDVASDRSWRQLHNRQSMIRFSLMIGVAAVLAVSASGALVLPLFSSLCLISALVVMGVATLCGEKMWKDHLTRWDEAAALIGVSLLASMFVDPSALVHAAPAAAAPPTDGNG